MRRERGWRRAVAGAVAAALAVGVLAGCGEARDADPRSITVWSLENQTDRVTATERIAAAFTKRTGIRVSIVAVDEAQFSQLMISAAAAGQLPDVIGALPLASVRQMASNELVDTRATKQIVDALGVSTFSEQALRLTSSGSVRLAVPSDAWAQILVYRKDLFAKAGLAPPDTYDALLAAARKLTTKSMAGITMATTPDDSFTEQTFEDLALANNCEMVAANGAVTLDSPQCQRAFALYGALVRDYSVPGAQDVDSTRATYFAGKAAMVIWSSFLLDELAGLRKDALPSCPECQRDPGFLARNSGVLTSLRGPDASSPAQFGEITSWVVTATAKTAAAKSFVQYMMSDGYVDWLRIAPEGKFPVRTAYTQLWKTLPIGVDTKKPIDAVYGPSVIAELAASTGSMRRWALLQGQGDLLGATLGELPVPRALSALADGSTDAAGAARQATADIRALRTSLQ